MVADNPAVLHWIDHFVVGTMDLERWGEWASTVLGAAQDWVNNQPTPPGQQPHGVFRRLAGCHVAAFIQDEALPATKGLAKGYPRYGMYVRTAEVDDHVRRLERLGIPHTGPKRTAELGEPGVSVCFEDPDQNQMEFWAPDQLPEGSMADCTGLGVGKLSHVVFESRDLDRSATFFSRHCGLSPLTSADIPADSLVLPLAAGARLVFKKVDALGLRTGGATRVQGAHTAFVIRNDDFMNFYERIWAELPEWEYNRRDLGPLQDFASLQPRTAMHGSDTGRLWKRIYGRGDSIIEWDGNNFHLVGGTSSGPTLANYHAHYMEEYVDAYLSEHPEAAPPRRPATPH